MLKKYLRLVHHSHPLPPIQKSISLESSFARNQGCGSLFTVVLGAVLLLSPVARADKKQPKNKKDKPMKHRGFRRSRRRFRSQRMTKPQSKVLKSIARALSDPNAKVRREAVLALSRFGNHGVPFLKKATASKHPQLRRQAIIALGRIGAPGTLKTLEKTISDTNAKVRREAVLALSRFGPKAVPILLKSLQSKDPQVRKQAIIALSRIHHFPRNHPFPHRHRRPKGRRRSRHPAHRGSAHPKI